MDGHEHQKASRAQNEHLDLNIKRYSIIWNFLLRCQLVRVENVDGVES